MAFAQKSKSAQRPQGDQEWVTIMKVLQGKPRDDGKEAGMYAQANNYKGRLIWQKFGGENGDDEANSTFYEVNSASILAPHADSPDFVLNVVRVNLSNPKAVKVMAE